MRTRVVSIAVSISIISFILGLIIGAFSYFASTNTLGVVGANDCCVYVNTVLDAEKAGQLDQIQLSQFNTDCGLRSGFMISHEYDGNAFMEFRSFCAALSIEVSVVYISDTAPRIDRTNKPICVDIVRWYGESVLGAHSNRRTVFDRDQYELYLASLERE